MVKNIENYEVIAALSKEEIKEARKLCKTGIFGVFEPALQALKEEAEFFKHILGEKKDLENVSANTLDKDSEIKAHILAFEKNYKHKVSKKATKKDFLDLIEVFKVRIAFNKEAPENDTKQKVDSIQTETKSNIRALPNRAASPKQVLEYKPHIEEPQEESGKILDFFSAEERSERAKGVIKEDPSKHTVHKTRSTAAKFMEVKGLGAGDFGRGVLKQEIEEIADEHIEITREERVQGKELLNRAHEALNEAMSHEDVISLKGDVQRWIAANEDESIKSELQEMLNSLDEVEVSEDLSQITTSPDDLAAEAFVNSKNEALEVADDLIDGIIKLKENILKVAEINKQVLIDSRQIVKDQFKLVILAHISRKFAEDVDVRRLENELNDCVAEFNEYRQLLADKGEKRLPSAMFFEDYMEKLPSIVDRYKKDGVIDTSLADKEEVDKITLSTNKKLEAIENQYKEKTRKPKEIRVRRNRVRKKKTVVSDDLKTGTDN